MGLASLLLLLPALAAASPLNQDAIDRNTVPVPKAGSTLLARGCSHNNCLRDVIASAFPTRPASADCASYLKTTVTPATTTITSTLTQTSTAITVLPVTASTTVPVTETATDEETTTTMAPATTVTIITNGVVIAPRQATPTSEIPAYASHCSVASKYVSACSCAYGLQPTTITAATPSTTVYVSATVTSVSTSLETVATLSMTTTAATETVTTTDKTVTVLPTATTYLAVFALQIVGGVADGQYLGNNQDMWYAPTASRDSAATFTYDPATGYVVDTAFQGRDGGYLSAYASGSYLDHGNEFNGAVALVCSIDAAAILSCSNTGPSNLNTFLSLGSSSPIYWYQASYYPNNVINLRAVA